MTRPVRRRGSDRKGVLIFPAVVVVAVVAGVLAATASTGYVGPCVFLLVLAGWVISLCLHEFAHSVVALAGGDVSVRYKGYLTLNPLRYTNPVYSLLIPLIMLAVGGIPLPGGAVLIETHRLRTRRWSSLISAAGPLTNFVIGILLSFAASAVPTDSGGYVTGLGAGLSFLAILQFATAILNVLPVPGFDGFGILAPFLSAKTNRMIAPIQPWAPLVLFAILWSTPNAVGYLFDPALTLFHALGGSRDSASYGQYLFQFWRH